MEAFLVSTGIVALAEMGDKTQLLALVLAARFRKPWLIVPGIFVATLANHAMAGGLGAWVTTLISPQALRWILGVSFVAMAAWMLIPDTLDDDARASGPRFGVFGTTALLFFLAEMGDKTQIATVMLAARYPAWVWVVAGTTLGMMLANVPVVWLGNRITRLLPLRVVHLVSALVFAALGLLALCSLSDLKNRSENSAGRGQILSILQVNSHSIDQKNGEIWTVQADLQPISFKSDRLPWLPA